MYIAYRLSNDLTRYIVIRAATLPMLNWFALFITKNLAICVVLTIIHSCYKV